MVQTTQTNEKKEYNIGSDDDPEEDAHDYSKELGAIMDRFMPYQRQIMIVGSIILVMLVVYLGFALGGLKVCSDLDGLLDSKFKCHPNYTTSMRNTNMVGNPFNIPNITIPNYDDGVNQNGTGT